MPAEALTRADALAHVRRLLARNPGWEDHELGELITSCERAADVALTASERDELRASYS
jgi:hypothetical protein